MNANLTPEQARAIAAANGENIRLTNPLTNEQYVLVKAAVFERFRGLLAEDTVYTTAEMLDRIMAEDDVEDPYLAELQKRYGGVQT
jgi:hypothetical protein